MTKNTILKGAAGSAAAIALAVGGVAISSGSSNKASSATAAQRAPGGSGSFRGGQPPAGAPQFGTPVTGTAAAKAKAAALAKYPGSVERVMKSPSGSDYEVHVITYDGSEVHVLVSASFQVTGTAAGGPPSAARPQLPQASGSTT
jgi:hypothetical protein